jgi:formate dehydrogenase subunit gamma
MFWLTAIVGGGPTARFWHPWLGLVFTASLGWMYATWRQDMLPTDADRTWWAKVDYYIRNEDEKLPAIGRYNFGQKLYFWITLGATIFLLLSGLLLWFPESIAPWLRLTAVTVHVIAALVTIGLFIIHVYMSTAMVRGSFTAMVTGFVTAAWAKVHYRLWYEQLVRRTPPQK